MNCPKCNGLMYTERFMDFDGMFELWKCINCGAFTDSIIFKNQHLSLHSETDTEVPESDETEEALCVKSKEHHYVAAAH